MVTIYHNPRCSKSRQTLDIIQEKGIYPEVILYLKEGLNEDILKKSFAVIGKDKMLRKTEEDYKNHIQGKQLSDNELISLMLQYPKIIERPLVVNGEKMALGRPPESVKDIL